MRITKYDPRNRDASGRYTQEEWTSVTDIGRDFPTGVLTASEYLSVENLYVNAVASVLDTLQVSTLSISELDEKNEFHHLSPELKKNSTEIAFPIFDGMSICKSQIEAITRLVLREVIWCKLYGDEGLYIHFGYDYYMYIGYDRNDGMNWHRDNRLFVEQFDSPYA